MSITLQQFAELMEGLHDYVGKTIVVKIGGNSIAEDENFLMNIARQIAFLQNNHVRVVLIHGGGPQIDAALAAEKVPSHFAADGRRMTSPAALSVIERVMKEMNRTVARVLVDAGCTGVMIAADQSHVFVKTTLLRADAGDDRTGTPSGVDERALSRELNQNKVLVLYSLGQAPDGGLHNVNADDYAMAIAIALKADRLLLVSKSEVLDKEKKRLSLIAPARVKDLIADGTISGGMIPKIESAVSALQSDVGGVAIINGHPEWALLGELLTQDGFGTLIR